MRAPLSSLSFGQEFVLLDSHQFGVVLDSPDACGMVACGIELDDESGELVMIPGDVVVHVMPVANLHKNYCGERHDQKPAEAVEHGLVLSYRRFGAGYAIPYAEVGR
jgi:hypothetical protein